MKQRVAIVLFLLRQAWLGATADSFDYIVVGGGTAGLAVASRLSENPSVRVAVIEPGADERSNPNVTNPSIWTNNFGAQTDWLYKTVPQPGLRNLPMDYHQGKALGGSSAINGMTYIRAAKHEIDAWETLGNKGWNFASLYPYYLRSENFTLPNDALQAAGVTFDASLHGDRGHVRTGYDPTFTNSSYTYTVRDAWANLGVPHNPDTAGGDVYGVATNPMTLDRSLNLRWDSARSYLHPAENRPNLKVIRGTGRRLTWATRGDLKQRSACGGERASGIEYISRDGNPEVLLANKEVILSAGSLRSPLILEASGVGNPRLLEALGIEVKVDLPGVGENYQEQLVTTLQLSGTVNLTGATVSQAFVSAADVLGDSAADFEARTLSELPQWAEKIASAAGGPDFVNKTAVETLLRLQHQLLFRENASLAESLIVVFEGGILANAYWALFPFSRGSVHLASADVADIDKPVIDPRFFLIDFDLRAQTDTGKLGEKLWRTEPLASIDPVRTQPGLDVLPEDATDAQWIDFTRTASNVNAHNLGTASMMSRELGGVVDPQLKVYGTSNVRVVDMSIFPMQHSGHPTATLYAVAERAADIIKHSPLYSS